MLYFKYIKMVLRTMLQYRFNLWLSSMSAFFNSFFALIGIYLLFDRFGSLKGWSFAEVALCFAVTYTVFSITECYARSFDIFAGFVISGSFDRILLRPYNYALQVMGANFEIARLSKLVQAIIVLGYAVHQLRDIMTPLKYLTIFFMIIGGVFLFTAIFILGASVCFFTVQGLEVINIFTDGGREISSYPLDIFNKWVKRFFTFIIPFGCINYLPLMFITDRAAEHIALYMITPLFGILFIIPALLFWRYGINHYLSTGS